MCIKLHLEKNTEKPSFGPVVRLTAHTPDPDRIIYAAAKICYSQEFVKSGEVVNESKVKKLLKTLYESGHMSPFEHALFTFEVSNISRVTTHQLVRHRLASFCQQSQRYTNSGNANVIVPESVQGLEPANAIFDRAVKACFEAYETLVAMGVPQEDARYILPHGTASKIAVSMNARELDHFFTLRLCKRAQWEIRLLAERMLECAKNVAPVAFSFSGPQCVRGMCTEAKGCEGAEKITG